MASTVNLANYLWLEKSQTLKENLQRPFSKTNIISNYILNTCPYTHG